MAVNISYTDFTFDASSYTSEAVYLDLKKMSEAQFNDFLRNRRAENWRQSWREIAGELKLLAILVAAGFVLLLFVLLLDVLKVPSTGVMEFVIGIPFLLIGGLFLFLLYSAALTQDSRYRVGKHEAIFLKHAWEAAKKATSYEQYREYVC